MTQLAARHAAAGGDHRAGFIGFLACINPKTRFRFFEPRHRRVADNGNALLIQRQPQHVQHSRRLAAGGIHPAARFLHGHQPEPMEERQHLPDRANAQYAFRQGGISIVPHRAQIGKIAPAVARCQYFSSDARRGLQHGDSRSVF